MAKQPVTVDRFKITAEVEPENLGPLLAQLAKMGLQNLGYELVTDVVNYRKNTQYQIHDIKAEEFAKTWMADHPTFVAKELIKHFRDAGRTDGAAYTALRVMVERGDLVKTGPGNYRRADVKEIAAPKEGNGHGGARSNRFEISNSELIWRHLRSRTKFKVSELTALMRANGREGSSATALVSKMCHERLMKKLGDGEYQVLKRPEKKPAKKPLKAMTKEERKRELDRARGKAYRERIKKEKLNGTQSTAAAETAHG